MSENNLILIVDDNKESCSLIKTILELNNYICEIRYNGLECIEYLKTKKPSLILLDIMMPVMDGFETLKNIKKDLKNRDIPIIIITAKNDEYSINEIFENGAIDYIEKPFKNFELLARVKSAINKSKAVKVENESKNLTIEKDDFTKLKDINKLKDTFLTCVIHDFKTPLTSIRALTELLLTNEKIPQEKRIEFLKNILKQADHLTEMINDIGMFLKENSENIKLNIKSVKIKEIIDFINVSFLNLSEAKKINFEIIDNSNIENINCDLIRIKELLSNLISNALKFTVKGKISLTIFNDNKNIYFEIKDTGIGINEVELSKIFEKFYKSNIDNSEGWGIGLYSAIRIAYAHGGNIIVNSEANRGSTFKVILPFNIAENILEF